MEEPSITVIVCAYNEELFIERTLKSLLAQDAVFPYEILVVDNGSTDRTAALAENLKIRVISCEIRGKFSALRRGVASARGLIVAVADADTVYPPTWISKIINRFNNDPKCVLVFGSTFVEGLPSSRKTLLGYLTDTFIFLSLKIGVVCSIGFNLAVRRTELSRILKDIAPYAYTGWAIGTLCLRYYGTAAILFDMSNRVPKCMRRYTNKGYLRSTSFWASQWLRLALGRNMTLMEAQYFDF